MDLLNHYFSSLTFQYVEEKQNYAVYVAAVNGLVGGDKMRCIIAFVPNHLGIQSKSRLVDLPWKNLQMRACPKGTYKVVIQAWKPPLLDKAIPEVMFNVHKREQHYSTYYVDDKSGVYFPFEVLMVNSPKKKTIYQYPNSMNLHWAIDQYNTVFNYIGDQNLMVQRVQENHESQVFPTYNDSTENNQNNNIEWL